MAGDANFASVALLLHCDGANNSTSFVDSSILANTMTVFGNAKISTAQSKFGGASAIFDGSGDYLKASTPGNFDLMGGDFTIEGWINCNAQTAAMPIFSVSENLVGGFHYLHFSVNSNTGVLTFSCNGTTSSSVSSSAGAVSTGSFKHVAVAKSGSTARLFVDGVQVGINTSFTATLATAKVLHAAVGIIANGYTDATFGSFNGYIDDLRVTKGAARYTAAFSVPTRAFQDGAGEVSGVVRDASNALVSRTVRAYRRDTGALVGSATSDSTTGAYSFYTRTTDEVSVIALDSATSGTIYNDVVQRVIPA